MQVASNGDLANWMIQGTMVKGMGGAMDLDGQHQAFGKTGRGTATQGQPKMMDDVLQAASAPGQWRENAIGEPYREHLSPTQNRGTAKAPDHHPQTNAAPGKRQIGCSAKISAVNSPRENTTRRACTVELP